MRGDDVDVRVADTQVTALHHAVQASDADFVLIPDAGDVLASDCPFEVARVAWQDPLLDLVYWDDDLADGGHDRHAPRFRPSWSPELLLGANYLGQSFALRRRRLLSAGSVRNGFGESMRWDLVLRCDLDAERVCRVPRVLMHVGARRETVDAPGVSSVQEVLDARGIPAVAEAGPRAVRLRWSLEAWPKVSIVVPTRHNRPMLSTLLPGLARTDYPSFEVRVIDNGGQSADNDAWYAENAQGSTCTCCGGPSSFNYSKVNNAAVRNCTGDVLVFLNDDIELPDRAGFANSWAGRNSPRLAWPGCR